MNRTRINYDLINEYWVDLYHRDIGKHTRSTTWCYGDVYKKINQIRTNMKKALCFVGCDNYTCVLTKMTNKGTGEVVYELKIPNDIRDEDIHEFWKTIDLPKEDNKNA